MKIKSFFMTDIFLKVLKNKSFNGKLILTLSAAIVALILVVVILFFQQHKLISSLSNSSRQTQTPVPTPAVSLPLTTVSYQSRSDWQSFNNESLGFKIQYPQDYKVGEVKTGERVEFLNCLTKGIRGEQLCRPAFEISVYADYDGGSRRVWLGKKYVLENPKYEDIMVDGSKGLRVINNNISQLVAIPRGKLMYVFGTDDVVSKTDGNTWPDKDFARSILSTFKFIAPIISEQRKDSPKNELEKTISQTPCKVYSYQDILYNGVGKHCLDKIAIKGVYFVAKDQVTGIKAFWNDSMVSIFTQIKNFYEGQFDNKMRLAIDDPVTINGEKSIEEYTQSIMTQEIRSKITMDTGSFVVLMIYPIQGENDKRLKADYGGGPGEGNSSSAMNSWFWLDPKNLGTETTKVGTNYAGFIGSAHEFGHALGIPHPWEEAANKDTAGKIINPNYGNDEVGSVMSYGGSTVPLIPNSFIRSSIKEKMVAP